MWMKRTTWAAAIAVLVTTLPAAAGTKVYVGKRHAQEQLVPLDQIDHRQWDRLLKTYVDDKGMVDYAKWKQSRSDQAALGSYLDALGRGNRQAETSNDARLAFWINAYNAVTVRGILREYPTDSIRNHTAKLYGYNIWKDLLLSVGGRQYSLDAMEHQILRKLGDSRIHFAIVCASVGCPRLKNEAYTPKGLQAQLTDNTRHFFSRAKYFRVDGPRKTVYVSPILKWFGEDFGPDPQKRLIGLADYLPSDGSRQLIQRGNFSVRYLDYDWSLNGR